MFGVKGYGLKVKSQELCVISYELEEEKEEEEKTKT